MTEPATTILSVRGDAQLEVAPDLVELCTVVELFAGTKAEALRAVAARLDELVSALRDAGGEPLGASSERRALGWLARSTTSWVEFEWNEKRQRQTATGRVGANVDLQLRVRDFAVLDRLGELLAEHETVHVQHVQWAVDDDNPAWKLVRTAAIDAAIGKGRDYAAALGGTLERIEHVADIGLLGNGRADGDWVEQQGVAMAAGGRRAKYAADGAAPSLDPVPQLLRAAIEARFTASVRALA